MFRDQFEYQAHVARQARAWQEAKADTEADQLRRVRVNAIEQGLGQAVRHVPDAFPALDLRALAGRVVDLIEGA